MPVTLSRPFLDSSPTFVIVANVVAIAIVLVVVKQTLSLSSKVRWEGCEVLVTISPPFLDF